MQHNPNSLIGIGIYTVAEAARLTGAPSRSIRRWMLGYTYESDKGLRESPAVWQHDIPSQDGITALSFLDLVEVLFVHHFRREGVSWPAIREAAERASADGQIKHPFATRKFVTDGNHIFEEIRKEGLITLFDVNKEHYVFHEIVKQTFVASFTISHDLISGWFPMYPNKQVVVDPERSFGRPILDAYGIPTETIVKALEVEESEKYVASLYDIPIKSVRAALEFEQLRAA